MLLNPYETQEAQESTFCSHVGLRQHNPGFSVMEEPRKTTTATPDGPCSRPPCFPSPFSIGTRADKIRHAPRVLPQWGLQNKYGVVRG
jgi:hypothetical protein